MNVSAFAQSLSLDQAKRKGLVGEKPDGLIGAVAPNPSTDIMELINKINSGRMDVYKSTAAEQGVPVSNVQSIAAQKIIGSTPSGQYIQQNGQWIKK